MPHFKFLKAEWLARHRVERWFNQVAAEILVPIAVLKDEYRKSADPDTEVARLAKNSLHFVIEQVK